MNRPLWARWTILVRLAVVLTAVCWLIVQNDWGQIRAVLLTADRGLLLVGLLVFGFNPVLMALRLKWLLSIHDIRLSTWESVRITFMASFLGQALPFGTSGGDAYKIWHVVGRTSRKHEAVSGVFFDRVAGIAGLVLISGLMVVLHWNTPALAGWGRTIGLLSFILIIGGALYSSRFVRRTFRLEERLVRLPLGSHMRRMDEALLQYGRRPMPVLGCVAVSILLQVFGVFSVFFCGWALGMTPEKTPWAALPIYFAFTPICLLSCALPLGVMEVVYWQLFVQGAGLGTLETATFLSLLNRVIQLIWASCGPACVAFRWIVPRPRRDSSPPAGSLAAGTNRYDPAGARGGVLSVAGEPRSGI